MGDCKQGFIRPSSQGFRALWYRIDHSNIEEADVGHKRSASREPCVSPMRLEQLPENRHKAVCRSNQSQVAKRLGCSKALN